jgi:ABC-type multidrug transport system fused ATPase/permease subunit
MLFRQMQKKIEMDYENMTAPDFKTATDKAEKALYSNHAPAMNIPRTLVELLSNSFGFLLYAGTIALIDPLILLLILITSAINWFMLLRARRYLAKTRETRSGYYEKLNALSETLRRPEAAKDIRIYGAYGWLSGLFRSLYKTYIKAERKVLSRDMHAQLADALMILIRDGVAYAFLIWLVLNDLMTLGDFVFIFAAIGALAGWVTGILTASADLARACIEMEDCRKELAFPDKMNTGAGIPLPAGKYLPPSIELRGVGYTYPGAENPALRNLNITIKAGERIAVVGANGAGKSTLVKLVCGLYLPTEGEILIGGNPVTAYNRDEYYTLFSPVFQDIHMLAVSIAENVSQQTPELTDLEKVRHAIGQAGLNEKIDSLPDKENTSLVRTVNPDATEFSGGEKQKLAMARALYKDAPVLILDEPTAALDPIAENEVYLKYAELTEGKTSVYISHRLASTRFCDRILLLDGSILAEEGTHDELIALDGVYANMFNIQAGYYQDGWAATEVAEEGGAGV